MYEVIVLLLGGKHKQSEFMLEYAFPSLYTFYMETLPSGTVTFLFTDIQGSTRLAQEHPDTWESLRARHHAILSEAIETHNGYVFQIIGDAFCSAFHTAKDGLNAALAAQRKLQIEFQSESPIKVRMGLHTGSAQIHGNEYHGYMTMACVQRVMSVSNGGQILLSNASAELIHNELSETITLRDMKEHRLKGLLNPERLWQVVAPDLQQNFPPLQSLNEIPNNLPVQLTTFIGREKEIGQIKKRLEKNRLVTLTGSGGIGKTRLSIQVASELLTEYPNGVWLVELAPLTDPALVAQAVCTALNVTPQGNTPALNVLTDYLRSKKILLVVDNCEHLIDACAQLCDSLLHACSDLRIIASSREALGIDGENAYRVPSLSLPDSHSGLHVIEESEAVKLFMERANAILPKFEITESNAPAIAQICQRLDGIALAIELAVSRVKILKVEQIASRLDDAFRLLTGGSRTAVPRQQTLRALIDWSYNLLSDEECTVLRRLSVFIGGWTLEAAEAVCGNANILDLLTHLVDKSLIVVDNEHSNETRYYLLETIRQYMREKLAESGEGEQIRQRHLDYFLKLALEAEPEIRAAGYVEWMNRLDEEHANLLAAMNWSVEGGTEEGQQLVGALWWSWSERGYWREGYTWLQRALAINTDAVTHLRIKVLTGAGWFAYFLGLWDDAKGYCEESISMARQLGAPENAAWPLATLGLIAYIHNFDLAQAEALCQESLALFKTTQNKWGIREVLSYLGAIAEAQEDYEHAETLFQESLAVSREASHVEGMGWALFCLGELASHQGNYARALALYEESQSMIQDSSSVVNIWLLRDKAFVLMQMGDYEQAKKYLEDALSRSREMGIESGRITSLRQQGYIALIEGDYAKARLLFIDCLQLARQLKDNDEITIILIYIGSLMLAQGFPEKFAHLLGMAESIVPDNFWQRVLSFLKLFTAQLIASARTILGEEAYTAAYAAGHQKTLDEAVAYALKELGQ